MNENSFSKMIDKNIEQHLLAPEDLTISEWSERNVFLPPGTSARPGKWKTLPYQHGIFEALEDPNVEKVSFMAGAQTSKTSIVNNTIGYYIAHEPQSQIMMQPTEGDLKTWLETKFNPMVDYSAGVKETLAKPRGREGVNNQKMKSYKGGFLMFAWSGSPTTMRGRSAPKIYLDEVDGYEKSSEGHPVNLLSQRAATFGKKRKVVLTSTPTIKGISFIEMSYEQGDRRKYFVPCPHCDHYQTLVWKNVKWQKDENKKNLPKTAMYFCENCGAGINSGQKISMVRKGEWRASMPFDGHASFHLNELYSPFRSFEDIARSFIDKYNTNDMQSFVNLSLAETWEETGETADPNSLLSRVETWDKLPDNCFFITAGIDIQLDRIEVQIIGWGVGEESWVLGYRILTGNTDEPQVWNDLSLLLDTTTFTHETGRKLRIESACLDTGGSGNMTSRAYEYIRSRPSGKPYAIKGKGGDVPLYSKPTLKLEKGKRKFSLYTLGVDEGKTVLYNRLNKDEDSNTVGTIHFNKKVCDDVYFAQLTAEKKVIRYYKGFRRYEWHNVAADKRNEALDTFIYALAALRIKNVDLEAIYTKFIQKKEKKK